ncbi:MAG: sialidase family protein [candidate division WOR-3 bacterium]
MNLFVLLLCTEGPMNLKDVWETQTNTEGIRILGDKVTTDFSNIRVNSDASTNIHNEEQVWMNPNNPQNIVAVWRDFRLGYRRIGIGVSTDEGKTWSDSLLVPGIEAWDSDPCLTVASDGTFYATALNFSSSGYEDSGFQVYRSTNGGMSWDGPFTALYSPGDYYFEDKEMTTCDRSGGSRDGYMYISWTRFANYLSECYICCIRSTDRGQTWNSPVRVSSSNYTQWSVPCVGSDGTLYVAWVDLGNSYIYLDKSTNGGASFGTDNPIVNTNFGMGEINGGILTFSFPAMDADVSGGPYDGNLYIAYAGSNGSSGLDIYFIRSTNGGISWSTPLRINDDPTGNGRDQFHPWLFVDNTGVIHVAFYDRRDDPSNYYFNLYYTKSTDGGVTWAPNRRVTSESSAPVEKAGLIGEYIGLAGHNGKPYLVWTDTREGHQKVYFGTDTTFSETEEGPVVREPSLMVIRGQLALGEVSEGTLLVYDATGRLAVSREVSGRFRVDLSGLAKGYYRVVLRTKEGQESAGAFTR